MRAILLLLSAAFICGCAYIPPSKDKAEWYAVLQNGGPGKYYPVSQERGTVCLMIATKFWEPLFTPDGPGGSREAYLYWANLTGGGPEYRNPAVDERDGYGPLPNLGTITVDTKNKKVIVDLQKIVSKSDAPLKTEPNPANGTYRIKRWVK